MKHTVIKYFTKQSEGFKPYNVGDTIELNKEDSKRLIEAGFVTKPKAKAKPRKKTD